MNKMNQKRYAVWTSTVVAASLLLTGCQLLTGYQQIEAAESAALWAGKIHPVKGEVSIACMGTYHCEITRIDETLIIAPETHQPVDMSMLAKMPNPDDKPLLDNKSVKVVALSPSGISGLTNYYARVKPIKREVHVSFYPENNLGYVERFAIIHEFAESTYQLRAYHKKSNAQSGSLLDSASPEPLCVELLQNGSVQRRFCKQLSAEQQGEFVETNIAEAANSPSAQAKVKA